MKDRESITIDPEINKKLKKEAKNQKRNFSNMIEVIVDFYLKSIGR